VAVRSDSPAFVDEFRRFLAEHFASWLKMPVDNRIILENPERTVFQDRC
jgi:hypothetical protein